MTINLFDDASWMSLRPLTFTRPVADLRIGILTIAEKWAKYLKADFGFQTQDYLSVKFAPKPNADLFINGSICPDEALLNAISDLKAGEALYKRDIVVAYIADQHDLEAVKSLKQIEYPGDFIQIVYPEHIFGNNPAEIRKDFKLLTEGRSSAKLSSTNQLLGDDIFLEEIGRASCRERVLAGV